MSSKIPCHDWCLCGGYDWPGNPKCPGNKPPEFTWPEASEECDAGLCDRCGGCDCPCHEDPGPVPGGPPMREGNNPRTGIAWNE